MRFPIASLTILLTVARFITSTAFEPGSFWGAKCTADWHCCRGSGDGGDVV